jgi:hypothetical protein
MAKLTNADQAIIPLEKFTEYCLNPEHPTGQHKARVFKAALGLTLDDATFLQATVAKTVMTYDATPQEPNAFGDRYVIDFMLTTAVGSAVVRSAWIVRYHENFPRLTSCYVLEDKKE